MSAAATTPAKSLFPAGRLFVGRTFDYLAIGGGMSLLVFAGLAFTDRLDAAGTMLWLPFVVLLSNSAHFASSTVRLYTKPGAFRTWPFLTMGLPLVTVGLLTVAVALPEQIGWHLQALYLTWSPFHYAAQAFGLACMYHYRSGGTLGAVDRRLIYVTCMLPFVYAFLDARDAGLAWLVPDAVLAGVPMAAAALRFIREWMIVLVFLAPALLLLRLYTETGRGLPLISWLIVVTNGVWWVFFRFYDAFVWATVFHGVQYLAIVTIFHVKDQTARAGNQHGRVAHTVRFYGMSLVLGYLLFHAWPFAYVAVGFGFSESVLLCAAVINIHHFIVDRYIWRLRKDDNYRVVVDR